LALVAEGNLRTDDVVSPVALLLILVLPMWLTSFGGTWFDFLVPDPGWTLYAFYVLVNLAWGFVVFKKARLVFPGATSLWCGQQRGLLLLRVMFLLVMSLALFGNYFWPDLRRNSGGMSNMLLGFSILAMVIVCARQVWRHDFSGQCHVAGCVMKFGLFAGFLVLSTVALLFFTNKVNDVLEKPENSRILNENCIFLRTFDYHDMWHMYSAIALALWVLVLLEANTRIWKRRLPERRFIASSGQQLQEGPNTWDTHTGNPSPSEAGPINWPLSFHVAPPTTSTPASALISTGEVVATTPATFQFGSTR